jgi:carbonic anhydrase
MHDFERILENNRRWVAEQTARDPEYFRRLAERQTPFALYLGCSDSRVPSSLLTGTEPGDLFVHRNVANLFVPSDLNALAVLEYAIDVLEVRHVFVTGHYGCGGVAAAMQEPKGGLVENWLGHIRNVIRYNRSELDAIEDQRRRFDRVVELNVLEQVYHLSRTPVMLRSWERRGRPFLHGLVYDIREGLLHPLVVQVDSPEKAEAVLAIGAGQRHVGTWAAGADVRRPLGDAGTEAHAAVRTVDPSPRDGWTGAGQG